MAELIKSRGKSYLLSFEGFLYYKNSGNIGKRAYWLCKISPECDARAVTTGGFDDLRIAKGSADDHVHAPEPDAVTAQKLANTIKRKAEAHPEAPPTQILRSTLRNVPSGVLAQLPDRTNLSKVISRTRLKNMPANPRHMSELHEIASPFRNTLAGDQFILYDSFEDEDEAFIDDRIIIFGTIGNLRQLLRSTTWFVDGTFKSSPVIFFQLFAIMGAATQPTTRGQPQTIGLPFIYALLQNKQEKSYAKVFEVVLQQARDNNIAVRMPLTVMSDFEVAIINSAQKAFGADTVRCCFFHLSQNVYRHIQSVGLQQRYACAEDSSIRDAAHKLLALAFVPSQDIVIHCRALEDDMPEDFAPVYEYFTSTYVMSRTVGRGGRRRIIPPRYSPALWCQYNAVMQQTARTNNISEGWHNRLQVVMGKDHPSFYAFISELRKEQADTEIMLRQLQLGQKIRKGQDSKRVKKEERIYAIVSQYDSYLENDDVMTYLKSLGHHVSL